MAASSLGEGSSAVLAGCLGPRVAMRRDTRKTRAFSLADVLIAISIVAVGFLGAFATTLQAGRMVSAAEENALACSGLEQRVDQLRALDWPGLTDGTGLTAKVWTARPAPTADLAITQETLTISPWDVPAAKTLQATWNEGSSPSVGFGAGVQSLGDAAAVKVVATLTWTGRRNSRAQTRSMVTVISRGGVSNSELP